MTGGDQHLVVLMPLIGCAQLPPRPAPTDSVHTRAMKLDGDPWMSVAYERLVALGQIPAHERARRIALILDGLSLSRAQSVKASRRQAEGTRLEADHMSIRAAGKFMRR